METAEVVAVHATAVAVAIVADTAVTVMVVVAVRVAATTLAETARAAGPIVQATSSVLVLARVRTPKAKKF